MNVRNHIHLTGNLGADPKMVELPSGRKATEFRLATNRYYRDAQGERQTKTEWHLVKAYGRLAEVLGTYLQKGSQVAIVGSMQYRSWTDKYDQPRRTAEVIAEEFTFLNNRRSSDRPTQEEYPAAMLVAEPDGRTAGKTNRRRKQATADLGEIIASAEAAEADQEVAA